MAYKRLGKIEIIAAHTWYTVYTVPGGKQAILSSIHCINLNAAAHSEFWLGHTGGAASPSNAEYILYQIPLLNYLRNREIDVQLGICMSAGDKIVTKSNVITVAVQAWGEESGV